MRRSPFLRFFVIFVGTVAVAVAAFLLISGRIIRRPTAPAPVTRTTPAPVFPKPPGPQANGWPAPGLEDPPDLEGFNLIEVSVPGSDLAIPPKSENTGDYVTELLSRKLAMPIEGVQKKDLFDSFYQGRNGAFHEAIDIMAPKDTPVRAVDQGNIVKLFNSRKGGLTIYQFDDERKYCYYYAHLDRYAASLKEGMLVRAGDVIGYVGSTGDANVAAPHLHFAISILGPEKEWWKGKAVNPYPVLTKVAQS